VLVVAAPLFVLAAVELALRLIGYGAATSFFVPLQDGRTLTANRRFGWQFMPRESATQPYPLLMPAQKPPGATRIFILGDSAAQGTPAPAFGFGRILEVMLRQQFPERRFEVVNVAMRGINSHVALPIARECARLAPDLFLVYMGNNETVGIHSPAPRGLSFTPYLRLLRAGQWLKGMRLAQLAGNAARALRQRAAKRPEQDMEFFRRNRLAADDPRRQAVYDNFRANLGDLCRVTRAAGAKVIVSTVAVNLKDFPPLASLHRAGLQPAELAAWESAWASGTNAEARGQFAAAFTNYLNAARLDDHFAELHFRLARCALAVGQADTARRHFRLARDWDALQFRADTRLNQIVRDTVALRGDSGLLLIDAERGFAEHAGSDGGIPGSRFFHEHVHLRFDGDYLLARLFLPMVAQALELTNSAAPSRGPLRAPPSRQECADALAFTAWDEISVTAAMLRLTAKPPFLDQLDHAQRQAQAEQALTRRGQVFHQQGGLRRALEVYRAATTQRPDDWQLHFNFGSLLLDFGEKPGAAAEFSTAVRLMPVFPALRMLLAQTLWEQGQRAEAIQQYQLALRVDPDYAPAKDALAQATGRRGR
jgi:tetratricopeptide (TPR) repeat protein